MKLPIFRGSGVRTKIKTRAETGVSYYLFYVSKIVRRKTIFRLFVELSLLTMPLAHSPLTYIVGALRPLATTLSSLIPLTLYLSLQPLSKTSKSFPRLSDPDQLFPCLKFHRATSCILLSISFSICPTSIFTIVGATRIAARDDEPVKDTPPTTAASHRRLGRRL